MTGAPIDLTTINTDGMSEDDLRALAAKARESLRSRDEVLIADIPTMSDEAIAEMIADHENRYDECDEGGGHYGYHDENRCPACVGRATLSRRKYEHERTLPGANTSNSYMTLSAEELVVTDQVKHRPNPGSKRFYYVEAMAIEFLDEETMRVWWRKTNTEERWVEGIYDRHESIDVNRTYPRG